MIARARNGLDDQDEDQHRSEEVICINRIEE